MKNVSLIVNGVLAVAIIVLYILHFTGNKQETVTKTTFSGDEPTAMLPVAYVNVDSLLLNYNYAKDLYELQMKSEENARLNLNQKMRELEQEAQEFQRKIENNVFLTRERATQEQQRLRKKEQDLQVLSQQMTNDLMAESQKMSETLRDTLVSQLKSLNMDRRFQIILSNTNGDNILLAEDAYDITAELIETMNKLYAPGK
ncbi:MAG: OmpH family outer membrane protein [Tannerellaceae bacterium]|jgi:outer membrane protein|nr:OmpH family outer membrane protein [Tannerellaceae bacterium]